MAKTLLQMLSVPQEASRLSDSALVIIDAQKEYQDGKLPLSGFQFAVDEIKALLERARKQGIPVWHVRHQTAPGAAIFDPNSQFFQIVDELKPLSSELILDKNQPSAFAGTNFDTQLKAADVKQLIVTGFMTHACISASVRSASALGYGVTVVADACATRDLPDATGTGVVAASEIHKATLAALNDVFATIVPSQADIKD